MIVAFLEVQPRDSQKRLYRGATEQARSTSVDQIVCPFPLKLKHTRSCMDFKTMEQRSTQSLFYSTSKTEQQLQMFKRLANSAYWRT